MTVIRTADQDSFWKIERRFEGETVFILGSGPSLTHQDIELLRGRRVVVVNYSYLNCPWADLLFFMDNWWYLQDKDNASNWPAEVVTLSKLAKAEMPDRVKRVKGDQRFGFANLPPDTIFQGRNSGQTAIGLVVAMGGNPVVLLGFDMGVDATTGNTHCHDEYPELSERERTVYKRAFLPGFAGWNAHARAVGVDVINASRATKLEEFRRLTLEEILSWRKTLKISRAKR